MYRFITPAAPRLTLELRAGAIAVETAEVEETTVELVPLNDSKATQEAIDAATVDQRGEEIVVHVPHRVGAIPGRGPSIAMRINAPHESGLHVKSGSAPVTATGRYGTTRVDTGSGDVELGEIVDSARIQSGSGDVRIQSVARDVVVKTGSGDIAVGTCRGEASFGSGSGDVELEDGGRAVDVKTGSGNIKLHQAPPDVRVTTGSGTIRLSSVREGDVRVKAASGSICVGVSNGTAAWLDLRSISGRVRSELSSGDAPQPDERTVRLHLSTASGNIELTRA